MRIGAHRSQKLKFIWLNSYCGVQIKEITTHAKQILIRNVEIVRLHFNFITMSFAAKCI